MSDDKTPPADGTSTPVVPPAASGEPPVGTPAQDATQQTPAAPTPPEGSGDAGTGDTTPDDNEVRKLRRENQRLRRERNELADAQEQARLAALSESERAAEEAAAARREAEAARDEARRLRLETEVARQAAGLRFHDPADALALLPDAAELVAEDGTVDAESVKGALEQLAAAKPHLVNRSGGSAGSPMQPGTPQGTPVGESDSQRRQRLGLERRSGGISFRRTPPIVGG